MSHHTLKSHTHTPYNALPYAVTTAWLSTSCIMALVFSFFVYVCYWYLWMPLFIWEQIALYIYCDHLYHKDSHSDSYNVWKVYCMPSKHYLQPTNQGIDSRWTYTVLHFLVLSRDGNDSLNDVHLAKSINQSTTQRECLKWPTWDSQSRHHENFHYWKVLQYCIYLHAYHLFIMRLYDIESEFSHGLINGQLTDWMNGSDKGELQRNSITIVTIKNELLIFVISYWLISCWQDSEYYESLIGEGNL